MEPTLCLSSAGAPTPPSRVLVGRSGHRYTIGPAPIGAGAQAEVWPALREDGLAVAVKLARPARSAIEALDSEGRYLEALGESGVACAVPCIDRVACDGRPGLVLLRLPRDVDDLVRARVAAAPDRGMEGVLTVGVLLARALSALHRADLARPGEPGRLVHRDVKPDNVLVDAKGRVHLADLGGSLLADGVAVRELGVFGSPLWAPPDQMLPGRAEPNPTWDTYAACVMVFTWVAGTTPSFQVDPRPRLRPRGLEILERMNEMATARPSQRSAAIDALFEVREGARVRDVVDARAPVRFGGVDRERIVRGVAALAPPQVYGDLAVESAAAELMALLERGLSPHATPSPPHRYWRAAELADALEAVTRRLGSARRRLETPLAPLPMRVERTVLDPAGGTHRIVLPDLGSVVQTAPGWQAREARLRAGALRVGPPADRPRIARGSPWLALVVVILAGIALWPSAAPEAPPDALAARTIPVPAGDDGPAARITRSAVSTREYRACVATDACTPPAWDVPGSPWQLGVGARGAAFGARVGDEQPVVGVTWEQAAAWCRWAGGALPTEGQRERAADGLAATTWEWTDTPARGGEARVLRGGAPGVVAGETEAGREARRVEPPDRVGPTYGFRCVFPE